MNKHEESKLYKNKELQKKTICSICDKMKLNDLEDLFNISIDDYDDYERDDKPSRFHVLSPQESEFLLWYLSETN